MRLGGWESLDMVLRHTRSLRFQESLTLYRGMERFQLSDEALVTIPLIS